jgi:hypothetical protein
MYKRILFLLILLSALLNARQIINPNRDSSPEGMDFHEGADRIHSGQPLHQTNKSFFIRNNGQWDSDVKYFARIGGMNAWITNFGIVFDYYLIKNNFRKSAIKGIKDYENKNITIQGHIVRMQLINTEKKIISVGNNQCSGYYNYFIGNDLSKWASYVPLYDNVELQGIYKNIDVKYYYDNGMLRYDYKAKPGADLSQIKFKFEGQEGISINSMGELILKTSIGNVTNGKIFAYQMEGETQKKVVCKFEQSENGTIGLKAENYNIKKELIIDPLIYSTFIGGSNEDIGNSIAIDPGGNAYVTGATQSLDYPVTTGAYQDTLGSDIENAFITKLDSTGSVLLYSTYLGGNNWDQGTSIALDAGGNVYITGATNSSNYPVTKGAYQTSLIGQMNAFVTKLNPTGSGLVYSTFLGGNGYDNGSSIAIDAGGNAFITGYTTSSNYHTTSGAYQTNYGGNYDAFVTELNSSGDGLVYSTFIGGNGDDNGTSIALDAGGNAYITGFTTSSNYPATKGAYQAALLSSNGNAFVTKLNSVGSALLYSTFIGGIGNINISGGDQGYSIAIDDSGNAYITGYTTSSNFPVTSGAFQDTLLGVNGNAFVTKLNSTGSALLYSTFIGGNNGDEGNSIALDAGSSAYITGYTTSSNFPLSSGTYQDTLLGSNGNAFVIKLNSTGSALLYSTYIGGNKDDAGNSLAIDAGGNVYVTGNTTSSNYPSTIGAYQTSYDGIGDIFVTKLNISTATFVKSKASPFPNKFELMQNYPNPFNPATTIIFSVPKTSFITIKIYDILGREIKTLVNEEKSAGNYSVQFTGSNLSSGIYFYRLQSGNYSQTKKLILLK